MIKEVKISNFKSIEEIKIKLNKLNLFCGENGSGKTTVLHSLLIATQKHHNNWNFDGEVIKIGDFAELKHYNKGTCIEIEVSSSKNTKKIILKRNENIEEDNKDVLIIEPLNCEFVNFDEQIFYLSSNRIGAMETYGKGNYTFGINGESAISFLSEYREKLLPEKYIASFQKEFKNSLIKENRKFLEHVRFWLEYITNEKINIDSVAFTNQYVLTFGYSNKIRPINTGSGYSYILPIVISCLGSLLMKDNSTIIIENPEIYLHPEAQFKLSDFFIFVSKYVQLIIETHSEHMLKRIMEKRDSHHQVLVFSKENDKTIIKKLTGKEFKTKPIAYPEVLYKAFNIPSVELHIILFSLLQQKCNNFLHKDSTISEFDKWLVDNFPKVPKKIRIRPAHRNQTRTLIAFIRNTIDHPESKKSNGKKFKYTEKELRRSIEFMLNKL